MFRPLLVFRETRGRLYPTDTGPTHFLNTICPPYFPSSSTTRSKVACHRRHVLYLPHGVETRCGTAPALRLPGVG